MGSITESFSNLSEYLIGQNKKPLKRAGQVELILTKVLRPHLPAAVRCGTGNITDVRDREVGPFDIVGSIDSFPPFGDGQAATYLADGVIFALQVRDWAEADLTQFGEMSLQIKKLERKKRSPIPCLAVSFAAIGLQELTQFLSSKQGQGVDGVLCLGHHIILRNTLGWYGKPASVPFVTEQPGPESLKAFTFFLAHLAQTALDTPFGLADYQHL